jgi:hypothetical protein
MENSSLIKILKTFSKEEMKAFERFVNSSYFNTSEATALLYKEIKKYYPLFEDKGLGKESLFKKVYGKQKYSEELIRKLVSNLIKLSEEFITQEKFKELKFYKSNFMLNGMLDRKLTDIFSKKYETIEKDFHRDVKIDENFYSVLHKLQVSRIYYHLLTNDLSAYTKQYERTADYFTLGFFNFILKTSAQLVNFEKVFNYKSDKALVSHFMQNFDFKTFLDSNTFVDEAGEKIAKMYYYNYMMLVEPEEEEHYYNYKKLFFETTSYIGRGENFNLLLNIESYASLKIHLGKQNFLDEMLYVYEKMFEMNIYSFSENEPLPPMQFRNILLCAMRTYDIKVFENLAQKCLEKIDKESVPSNTIYIKALTAFKKKDYGSCLSLLGKIDLTFFGFKTDYRNFQLMSYYELELIESAISLIDSYRHFVSSNPDLSPIFREGNANFIKFINELVKLKSGYDGFKLQKLERSITETPNVFNKWWLLEKAREFTSKSA